MRAGEDLPHRGVGHVEDGHVVGLDGARVGKEGSGELQLVLVGDDGEARERHLFPGVFKKLYYGLEVAARKPELPCADHLADVDPVHIHSGGFLIEPEKLVLVPVEQDRPERKLHKKQFLCGIFAIIKYATGGRETQENSGGSRSAGLRLHFDISGAI